MQSRQNMESVCSRNFSFCNCYNRNIWKNIYRQKIISIEITKIKVFNFKILYNTLPCGKVLSKWKQNSFQYCDVCRDIETVEHMLYGCHRINEIWKEISQYIKCNMNWKQIVCGRPSYDVSHKVYCLNVISSVVAIFKENSYC